MSSSGRVGCVHEETRFVAPAIKPQAAQQARLPSPLCLTVVLLMSPPHAAWLNLRPHERRRWRTTTAAAGPPPPHRGPRAVATPGPASRRDRATAGTRTRPGPPRRGGSLRSSRSQESTAGRSTGSPPGLCAPRPVTKMRPRPSPPPCCAPASLRGQITASLTAARTRSCARPAGRRCRSTSAASVPTGWGGPVAALESSASRQRARASGTRPTAIRASTAEL
mmetsp:Transcript_69949/g.193448  ORF Transcript_69949/g.193448 Transcript_69949/m.193448 type:complete len:223 (-) Transcript_69949:1601-2269(-)